MGDRIRHVRFMHFLFLLAPMVLARDLARGFPAVWARTDADPSARASVWIDRRTIRIGIILIGAGVFLAPFRALAPPPTAFPARALAAAEMAGLDGPVYNGYSFGGALVFAGVPSFVDGRSDRLYNDGFVHGIERSKTLNGGALVAKHVRDYDITWTFLRRGDPRISWFDAATGWDRLYEDQVAVIHRRRADERESRQRE